MTKPFDFTLPLFETLTKYCASFFPCEKVPFGVIAIFISVPSGLTATFSTVFPVMGVFVKIGALPALMNIPPPRIAELPFTITSVKDTEPWIELSINPPPSWPAILLATVVFVITAGVPKYSPPATPSFPPLLLFALFPVKVLLLIRAAGADSVPDTIATPPPSPYETLFCTVRFDISRFISPSK
ncbi:hypothetical protein D3C73_585600 [compost metagenome]